MARKKYFEDYLEFDKICCQNGSKTNKKKESFLNSPIIGVCLVGLLALAICFKVTYKTELKSAYSSEIVLADEIYDDTDNINFINSLIQTYNNNDIKLFLSIFNSGNTINYSVPVVQSSNNTYYTYHSLNKNYDMNGSAFIDSTISLDQIPKNLVIYGNDQFEEAPFYNIINFEYENIFDKNKKIEIKLANMTLYYEVFAFVKTDKEFEFEKTSFDSKSEFNEYLEKIKSDATYFNEVDEDDELLTLSTTSVAGDRYKLYAKRVNK